MQTLIELLKSDDNIICNKKLARNIGLHETILYSELLSKYLYFSKNNQLNKYGYFFNTVENMQQDTTLSDSQQRKTIKNLGLLGLIKYRRYGMPAKRCFKIVINQELLKKYLF